MGADIGEHLISLLMIPVEEILGGLHQGGNRFKVLPLGDGVAEMAPRHFDRVQPGAVRVHGEQHQAPGRRPDNGFDFLVLVRAGIISGVLGAAGRVFVDQRLQQFGHFAPALAGPEQDHRFPGVIVDGPNP